MTRISTRYIDRSARQHRLEDLARRPVALIVAARRDDDQHRDRRFALADILAGLDQGVEHVAFAVRRREQLVDGALELRWCLVSSPRRETSVIAEGVDRDVSAAQPADQLPHRLPRICA